MLHMMLFQMTTLLMAGMGLGTTPMPTPSPAYAPEVACVTSVSVTSSMTSSGTITVSANGTTCSNNLCSISPVAAGSTVSVTYAPNNGQFVYLEAGKNAFTTSGSITASSTSGGTASLDFAVAGASNGTIVTLPDPTITVTTGSCGGGDRR